MYASMGVGEAVVLKVIPQTHGRTGHCSWSWFEREPNNGGGGNRTPNSAVQRRCVPVITTPPGIQPRVAARVSDRGVVGRRQVRRSAAAVGVNSPPVNWGVGDEDSARSGDCARGGGDVRCDGTGGSHHVVEREGAADLAGSSVDRAAHHDGAR